jgi:lysophospholipase L1-like esterase
MSRWINSWFAGKLPVGSRMAYIGDSLVQTNHTALQTSGVVSTVSNGELNWARAIHPRFRADTVQTSVATIGGRFIRGANCAVQGAQVSSSQDFDLEEQAPVALAYGPQCVFIAGGTNDLSASDTATNLQTELTARVEYFLSRGIRVILCTIRPRSTSGVGWNAGNQRWTELQNLNTWIRSYCASGRPGLYLFDPWNDLRDVGAPQVGEVIASYVYDAVHLNATGAQVSGLRLAPVIDRVFSSGVFWDTSASNLLPGAAMTGTGGTRQGATGDVATGWTVQKDGGVPGNIPVVCSKVNGDTAMQLVFTSDGLGTGTEGCNILTNPGTLTLTSGRWYQMMVPVEFEQSDLWTVQSVQLRTLDNRYQYGHIGQDTTTPITSAWSGWLVTEPFLCQNSNDESIRPSVRIVMRRGIATTGTMRMLAGARLSEVPAP